MKKTVLASLLLLATNLSVAAPMTSDIQLQSTFAGPGQTGNISLSKLAKDIPYDVTCIIASNGTAQQEFDAVKTNFNAYALDGKFSYGPYGIMKLPAKGTAVAHGVDLLIPSVFSEMLALEFTNLDDTDKVSVTNCVAKIHFNP